MSLAGRMRLIGCSTVLGLSLCTTEIMASIIRAIMHLLSYTASPILYGAFGGLTTVLVASWLTRDAAQAFSWADGHCFLTRDSESSKVVAVRENCPKAWLVTIHILLHTEVIRLN